MLPVRWTAPEAIGYRRYTSASDVWSFSVMIHEVYTKAETPYRMWNNVRVVADVGEGCVIFYFFFYAPKYSFICVGIDWLVPRGARWPYMR
jgi:serine/threonine protein kinase